MSITELPPGMAKGFRFHPTDKELIFHYLRPKILGTESEVDDVIAEVDFYQFEPWDLPPKSKINTKDRIWFFFCRPDKKNQRSKQSKRSTKTGFWKITAKEREIKDKETKTCIGKKRILVFHKGPAPGERTNWVMHEYYIEPHNRHPTQRSYVLCRLKEKANDKANSPDSGEGNPSGNITSEVENPVTPAAIPLIARGNEVNQESLSQSRQSPVWDSIGEEISLLPPVGFSRDRNEMQALYEAGEPQEPQYSIVDRLIADPDADLFSGDYAEAQSCRPCYEDGPFRSNTNIEGVKEQSRQARQGLGLPDSPVGIKRTLRLQMAGISSGELQGDIPRKRHLRGIQLQDRVSSTAASGNAEGSQELQGDIPRERRPRRLELQGRVSSTEISRHRVHREAATDDSISLLACCVSAVIIMAFGLVAFGLVVLGVCDMVLSQLRRKRTIFLLLCSGFFFWVYRKMYGASSRNAMELNPTAHMLP